jgi:serine protease Do
VKVATVTGVVVANSFFECVLANQHAPGSFVEVKHMFTGTPARLDETTIASSFSQALQRVYASLVVVQSGRTGVGAGLIWDRDGLVLTNNHVAGRHHHLRVRLPGGRDVAARLVARQPEIDLALLEIEPGDYTPAWIGDSQSLCIGELVLAVGHPWGQPGYATLGVVSALGFATNSNGGERIPVIRSDAAMAPGNSGGPLVNVEGAVIGINTMIVGGDQGVAIPIHVAARFAEEARLERCRNGNWRERVF